MEIRRELIRLGARAKTFLTTLAVSSVEPSSTTISSLSGLCEARYSKTSLSVFPIRLASLKAGIIIDKDTAILTRTKGRAAPLEERRAYSPLLRIVELRNEVCNCRTLV